jgi:putative flippase GtrA/SAM-dependent methyltransferase
MTNRLCGIRREGLRVVRFGLVGAISTLTYCVVAIFAIEGFNMDPVPASAIGAVASIGFSYLGHAFYSFQVEGGHRAHLSRFILLALVGLGLGSGLMWLTDAAHVPHRITIVMIAVLIPVMNYLCNRFWVFAPGLPSAQRGQLASVRPVLTQDAPRTASGLQCASGILVFPNPSKQGQSAFWDGTTFNLGDRKVRVLAYDVSPSGWTDALTQLHEDVGGSNHFIEVASRRHALTEVGHALHNARSVVLEIGVSSGVMLRELIANFPEHVVIGADYTRGTLDALGERLTGVPLLQFDLTRCPLPDNCIDVVVALNVLEHIGDHTKAIAELFRILRPGGRAIIEVPAGPALYDVYDRALMHHRRYAMAELIELFKQAGFSIEQDSHLGLIIYPAFYVSKRLNQLRYRRQNTFNEQQLVSRMIVASGHISALGTCALRLEEAIRPYLAFPWGIRCLLSASRPTRGE